MRSVAVGRLALFRHWVQSSDDDDPESRNRGRGPSPGRAQTKSEELSYKVELWNDIKRSVDQVLAVTSSAGIGFAAYYAATKEYPNRYVTLSDKNGILSRWNGPTH